MKKIKEHIARLNWYGFILVFAMSGGAAFSRDQDPSLLVSFYVWLILGLPLATLFLFIGIEPKNIDSK